MNLYNSKKDTSMKKIVLFCTLLIAQSLTAMQESREIIPNYAFEFAAKKPIRMSDASAFRELLINRPASIEKFRALVDSNTYNVLPQGCTYKKTVNWKEIENNNNEHIKKLMDDTRSFHPFLLLKGGVLTFLAFAFLTNLNDESYLVKATSLLGSGLSAFYGTTNLTNGLFYHEYTHKKIQENEIIALVIKNQLSQISLNLNNRK